MKKITIILFLVPYISFAQSQNSFSEQEKLYGLSKIWKEVEYNYAYFEKIGNKKWDSLYIETINKIKNTKSDYEYFRELQKFIAFVQDGHTRIIRFPHLNLWTSIFYDYLIEFEWVEEKVIVSRINTEKKNDIPIGSELIEVNGMQTLDYMEKNVIPIIPASTEHVRIHEAVKYIFDGVKYMKYQVKLITPLGEIISKELVHNWDNEKEFPHDVYPPRKPKKKVIFKWLDNNIAYMAINTFRDTSVISDFKKHLPELYKADGILIDIRENGGGNTHVGLEILTYFSNDSILYRHKSRSRKHLSINKANGVKYSINDTSKAEWIKNAYLNHHNQLYTESAYQPYKIKHNDKRILKPTIILTSYKTESAAEGFLVPIHKLDHIKTIGETTSGSTGTPYKFDIIGGAIGYICTLQSFYPDGTSFVGVGIKPNIEIKKSIDDIINQTDSVLIKALAYLNQMKK